MRIRSNKADRHFVMLRAVATGSLTACTTPRTIAELLPHAALGDACVYPGDRTLNRPEDGVALSDGRLIVADQYCGFE